MTTSSRARVHGGPKIHRVVRTGSSGALVVIVNSHGVLRAVKTARRPRVTAVEQQLAREAINDWFPGRLPAVLFAGKVSSLDVLVTECPSSGTLADLVTVDPVAAQHVWADVVGHVQRVWQASARPGFDAAAATRNHQMRWQRARAGLNWSLDRLGIGPVSGRLVVNGADLGTLDGVLRRLGTVPAPLVHVACQGDPQPRNVLVDTARKWHLVDWEWAGTHHDWRMLVSHLLAWWQIENFHTAASGDVTISQRGDLELSYDRPAAPPGATLAPGVGAFDAMTTPAHRDADLTALANHLAMLHLREIPNAARDRPWLVAPLLGEAARLATGPIHYDLLRLVQPDRRTT